MSGHSKWSSIKHGKAITDARRGQLFTKLTRDIIGSARQGGGNPDANIRLRMAIQRAKDKNMPLDNIERAIKRGTGEGTEQSQMVHVIYEGYAPGGAGIILEALTDNRNRTASDIRSTFSKAGGSLAEAGSVAWQFEHKGVIAVEGVPEAIEEVALVAIDAGVDNFEVFDTSLYLYTPLEALEEVQRSLSEEGIAIRSSELSMVPTNTVPLGAKMALQTLRLLDCLEELDDVQRVFSNADFPDEALERYRNES